jgi:hypothetical protein
MTVSRVFICVKESNLLPDFCGSSTGERKTGEQAKVNVPVAVKCLRFRGIFFSGREVGSHDISPKKVKHVLVNPVHYPIL